MSQSSASAEGRAPSSADSFLLKTERLIGLEHDEERAQSLDLLKNSKHAELARLGVAILKLYLHDGLQTGLYGRVCCKLQRYNPEDLLSAHRLSSGDIVGLFDSSTPIHELKPLAEGVVNRVRAREIEVVFSQDGSNKKSGESGPGGGSNRNTRDTSNAGGGNHEDSGILALTHRGPFHLAVVASDATITRYRETLGELRKGVQTNGDAGDAADHRVVRLAFSALQNEPHTFPDFHDPARFDARFYSAVTRRLNGPQQAAVKAALLSRDMHVIHGPPGTGKTTTCVAFILECVLRGYRILVTAPSNVAVDNLLLKVAEKLASSEKGEGDIRSFELEQKGGPAGTSSPSTSSSFAPPSRAFAAFNARSARERLVRFGHPARIDTDLHRYTLDARVAASEEQQLCRDIEKEIKDHADRMFTDRKAPKTGTSGAKSGKEEENMTRYARRQEVSRLRKELKKRSIDAVNAVLKNAQVVFSTCAGATMVRKAFGRAKTALGAEQFGGDSTSCTSSATDSSDRQFFDVVLVDEAAQTLEVACWIPVLAGKRAVLAGDHQQLAATVKSKEAMREGLDVTLFARMHAAFEKFGVASLLSIQYRMNEVIMGWSSEQFYEGRLVAAEEVKDHTLELQSLGGGGQILGLGGDDGEQQKQQGPLPKFPLVFADTAGNALCKETESDAQTLSRSNTGEANIVLAYLKFLVVALRVSPQRTSICVITPYNQQVDLLKLMLVQAGLERLVSVNTVDSFQGREADIVILSLVRSNDAGEVGFLADFRRLNVAVTRARKHVLIVANSCTICTDEVLAGLYGFALERGKVVFASEACAASECGDVSQVWRYREEEAAGNVADADGWSALAAADPAWHIFDEEKSSATGGFGAKGGAAGTAVSATSTRAVVAEKRKQPGAADAAGVTETKQPEMVKLSDEEVEKRRIKYAGIIAEMRAKRKPFHDFSKNLNARERLIVHEICEKEGLRHESQGEGKKRFVRVYNDDPLASGTDKVDDAKAAGGKAVLPENGEGGEEEAEESQGPGHPAAESSASTISAQEKSSGSSSSSASSRAAVAVPEGNGMLAKLAMEREARQERQKLERERRNAELKQQSEDRLREERHKKQQEKKANKAAAGKKGPAAAARGKEDDDFDDFEALLGEYEQTVANADGKCQVCKASVRHMDDIFTRCEYCKRQFCLTHIQAEVHGCGDAAAKKAKSIHQKKGVNPQAYANVSDRDHKKAQNNLRDALKEKEKERARGKAKSDKKS